MKRYTPPKKEFLMLPNSVFDMPLDVISLLEKRKLIAIKKHKGLGKYKNNVYVLLPQDNPEIYRDLSEPEELPLII